MSMEERAVQGGMPEQLEAQANRYLAGNPDGIFRDYLQNFKRRLRGQNVQVDILQDELDRSYQMYLRRMEINRHRMQGQEMAPVQNIREEVKKEEVQGEFTGENSQYMESRNVQPPKTSEQRKSGNVEFMIGAAILSIVGGTFILTALVMLGVHFMNGFAKGMCLYAGAILLMLVSELAIHKRWPKLAKVFSAISIGGLYLFTVINYLSLHNFGMQVAVIVTLAITLFVLWLSRKRDSLVYRILALIASYLCLFTVNKELTSVEALVLIGIILLINILCVVMPMRKYNSAFHCVHMGTNMLFAMMMNGRLKACGISVEYRLVLLLGLVLIMQLVLIAQMRFQRKEEAAGNRVDSSNVKTFYWVGAVVYSLMLCGILWFAEGSELIRYGSIVAVVIICIGTMIALWKYPVKWYPYYLLNLVCLHICYASDNIWEPIICLTVLLVIAKILSLWRIPALKFCDAFITTLTCVFLLGTADEKAVYVYVLLAGVVLSVFFISQWQTYFELLLTYTLGFFVVIQMEGILQLPAFVGLLFVGLLLFNNVPRFRGKNIVAYNGLVLAGEIVCFLLLNNPVYRNAYITYLCMLVFGLATIVLTFQKKYHMDFKGKHLILAAFLTYMAFIVRTSFPVINSILLMLIALVCVGIGFYAKEKSVRIYGLVLSLLVCGKIVLYDYRGTATLQKTVLFLVVGVIALIIAGIYIILEKKNSRD